MPLTPGEPEQPRFSISNRFSDHWTVYANEDPSYHLHSDGMIRQSTRHDGEWSGWFASREDALAAIERWRERQTPTEDLKS